MTEESIITRSSARTTTPPRGTILAFAKRVGLLIDSVHRQHPSMVLQLTSPRCQDLTNIWRGCPRHKDFQPLMADRVIAAAARGGN